MSLLKGIVTLVETRMLSKSQSSILLDSLDSSKTTLFISSLNASLSIEPPVFRVLLKHRY